MGVVLKSTNNLYDDELVTHGESATQDEVLAVIEQMPWEILSMVELTNSQGIKLEGSGSEVDGYSLTYTISPKSYLSKQAPTFEQMKQVLSLFSVEDKSWQTAIEFQYWQNEDGYLDPSEQASRKGCMAASVLLLSIGLYLIFAA